jgi:hypothetical protein
LEFAGELAGVLVGLCGTVWVRVLMAILLGHAVVLRHTVGAAVCLVAVVALRLLWGLTVHCDGVSETGKECRIGREVK